MVAQQGRGKLPASWAGQVMDVLAFRPCSVQYFELCHENLTRCSLDQGQYIQDLSFLNFGEFMRLTVNLNYSVLYKWVSKVRKTANIKKARSWVFFMLLSMLYQSFSLNILDLGAAWGDYLLDSEYTKFRYISKHCIAFERQQITHWTDYRLSPGYSGNDIPNAPVKTWAIWSGIARDNLSR